MSRSQGAKVGRFVGGVEVGCVVEREMLVDEIRTEAGSDESLFNRTFLIEERLAGSRSLAVADVAVDCFGVVPEGEGLEMDSSTRWNFRFFDSTA